MKKLRWSPEAVQDLARLREFLGTKNAAAAARAAGRIMQAATLLRDQPELGRGFEDEEWREMVAPAGRGAYLLRYRVEEDAIVIVRVWHAREER